MTANLRNRLLLLLLLPLCALALVGMWVDYRSAAEAATQHDQRLLRLLPVLADSVLAPPRQGDPPLLLLAPPVAEFLRQKSAYAGFSVRDAQGRLLLGDAWVRGALPSTHAPEFHSEELDGVTYRVAVQRGPTAAGELVVALADGSDPRQQWAQLLLVRVLLPNLVLVAAAALAIHWAVRRAFKPLVDLTEAVERRSPRDLSAIDEAASPVEVRPLVHSLNQLFALVEAQAEGQRRFVADAAHQLRTPLAGLQAQVEAWALMARAGAHPDLGGNELDKKVPPAHAHQAHAAITLRANEIEKLRDATRRTSQLAHQLLALSRADARSLEAQAPQRVDLKDLCESLLEMYLDAAMGKGLDLGVEVHPAHVTGHGWLLRELLSNLVDNAIQYTPAGGSVTIRCGLQPAGGGGGACAFLQVEDNGPGVPQAERARVVQRFYRVPGTQGEGTGLGLAIADEIARVHGAALTLGSGAHGQGLRVTLVFAA
ncbi:sensor histidine kinase [Acidovorax sp. SRB_24]|uniref:sensor histidine kinase n=1 Tax=Acidovorax sp. SRB_24 TaxID=1962700 RepID=UPI00145E1BD1|nr:sensor histidine kinase [Acidovorax sp. SRB_24]NMM77901.1 sensor histidine kinase [Acidovorax sp. SRB_24]NMM78524.1 sensor histidine kinase [Acidovorax sp. SRB_24]NMM78835.1 sensor histidine kinase [Acidovorax sp. SRB_24]